MLPNCINTYYVTEEGNDLLESFLYSNGWMREDGQSVYDLSHTDTHRQGDTVSS